MLGASARRVRWGRQRGRKPTCRTWSSIEAQTEARAITRQMRYTTPWRTWNSFATIKVSKKRRSSAWKRSPLSTAPTSGSNSFRLIARSHHQQLRLQSPLPQMQRPPRPTLLLLKLPTRSQTSPRPPPPQLQRSARAHQMQMVMSAHAEVCSGADPNVSSITALVRTSGTNLGSMSYPRPSLM